MTTKTLFLAMVQFLRGPKFPYKVEGKKQLKMIQRRMFSKNLGDKITFSASEHKWEGPNPMAAWDRMLSKMGEEF